MRNKEKLNSALGTFNTITRMIEIDHFCIDDLTDTVDSWLNYYTFYHEQIHYYQFVSSTLGLFLTCLMDMEYEIIAPLVQELDFTPPFINCVEKQADEFNEKLHLLREIFGFKKEQTESINYVQNLLDRISEIELFIFILEGDFSFEKLEQVTKMRPIRADLMYIMYYYVSHYYDHVGKDLSASYDGMIKKFQQNGIKLSDNKIEDIIFMPLSNGLSFGYNSILESHARYCELTRLLTDIAEFDKPEILIKVKNELTKQDDYQAAYNIFTSIVVNIPRELTPLSVGIFCLVCDYAIQIPVPQVPQLPDSFLALYDFNLMMPAPRFISICGAVNRALKDRANINIDNLDFRKGQVLELKTLDEWNHLIYFLYDIISEDTGYPSPISIAKAFVENNYTFDIENIAYFPFDYDNAVFLEACKTRIEYPLFFINPELFGRIDREKYIEISNAQGPQVMQTKTGLTSFSERKAYKMQQGHLTKRVLSNYLSGLFFGYGSDIDLEKIFGKNIQDAEKVICNKYGKLKRFW